MDPVLLRIKEILLQQPYPQQAILRKFSEPITAAKNTDMRKRSVGLGQ